DGRLRPGGQGRRTALSRGSWRPPRRRPRRRTAQRNERGAPGEPLDEVERRLGDLAPAVVDREQAASVRDLHYLRHPGVAPLPLVGGVRDRPRPVWSFSPSMISSGPRSEFFVFTFASVHGLRFALPICASAIPEPATWNVS